MPHMLLEYSNNVVPERDVRELVKSLHHALGGFESIRPNEIKCRWAESNGFYLGDGDRKNAFVHLRVELLSGRSSTLKKEIGAKLLALLQHEFREAARNHNLDISIEIRDMDREAYFKAAGASASP